MIPTITDTRSQIDAALTTYCKQKQQAAAETDASYGALWAALSNTATTGGKRLRPYMILLAYQAYGGKGDMLAVATAWEMLHVSLLMHDDIIDRDYMRHGQPNVAGQYLKTYAHSQHAEHYANSAALLAGDLVLGGAYDIVLQSSISAEQKAIAMQAFCDCLLTTIGGQLIDTESVMHPINQTDAEKIAYLKTARYSFIDPLVLGAKLAGAPESELVKISDFGKAVGIGFQLADDLLGMFGDQNITGKTTIGDLREGKRTMLLQEVMARVTQAEGDRLQATIGRPDITESEADHIRALARSCGAEQAIKKRIDDYDAQSKLLLQQLAIPQEFRDALQQVAQSATKRSH